MTPIDFGRSDPRRLTPILVLSALIASALSLAAWFALPFARIEGLPLFTDAAPRLAVVLMIVVAWGALNALLRAGRNSADQARLEALHRQEQEAHVRSGMAEAAREAAFVRIRSEARRALRRRALADLWTGGLGVRPRYLVVGPIGSGKSSALAGADLNLPYAAREAAAGASDIGCRFLPSDAALYVDVAGDLLLGGRPEWVGLWPRLLDLIRAGRSARPVDGIVLVVAATDLAGQPEETRIELARSLRDRLDQIAHHLHVSVPVYLLLSKLDRISGFSEFFDHLGAEERAQIWGISVTAAHKAPTGPTTDTNFDDAFDDLVRRAVARQLDLLHSEPDAERRTRAFEFPAQLASLRECVSAFLKQLARSNQFDGAPRLCGVFMASSYQDGGDTDAIDAAVSRTFVLPPERRKASRDFGEGEHSRAYFLRRLFNEIIPAEAGTGHLSARGRRLARTRVFAVRAVTLGAALAAALLIWSAYRDADPYIARIVTRADAAQADLGRLALDDQSRTAPTLLPLTLTALDDLAGLKAAADAPAPETFVDVAQVRRTAFAAYTGGLETLLVPLVMQSLRARLADANGSSAVRFECLKLYLLLGEGRRVPAELLADLGPMLVGDQLGSDADAGALQRAMDRLAMLADVQIPAQPIDMVLIAQTRSSLARATVPQIGYEILREQPSERALKPWRPIEHTGSLGSRVIARASGVPLSQGISGLFTAAGQQDMRAAAPALAEALADDAWVFGPEAVGRSNLSARAILTGILDLYSADYIRTWEEFLADLTVPPLPTTTAATDVFGILYGASSPIQQLLEAVAAETSPSPQAGDAVLQGMGREARASSLAAAAAASPIAAALLSKAARPADPSQLIARHFAGLREVVAKSKDGQDSEVEAALKSLDPLYRQLLAAGSGMATASGGANAALAQVAIDRLPPSIHPYFKRLAAEAENLVRIGVRGRAAQVWATSVQPVCRAIVAKAFPFDRTAARQVTLTEFTQLFSPSGLIATFRRTQLADLIDAGAHPWRWRDGHSRYSDGSDPTLTMFERADAITAAFFAEGDRPQIHFTLDPLQLDPKVDSLQFDVGGASLRYAHGPDIPFVGQWPAPVPDAPATLSLRPELDGKPNSLIGQGPWGLFRLVAQGRSSPSGNGLLLAFDVGGRRALLKLAVSTLQNPFSPRFVSAFNCPEF